VMMWTGVIRLRIESSGFSGQHGLERQVPYTVVISGLGERLVAFQGLGSKELKVK
jgi:hypothetical protein